MDGLGEILARSCPAQRYAVVSDSTVSELLGARVVRAVSAYRPCDLVPFPAGEWNKTAEHWRAVSHHLLGLGLGRDAAVVALGGGVVGDLAGFVAATYMRGIPCVQVPTTLLAMIDSSIGGKTGIDTEFGKNLLGAFHQPRAVVADIATLDTLPPIHLAAGMAEALKHGAIADAGYFRQLIDDAERIFAHDREALHAAVRRSVEIKAEVVANDEREAGRRAILNFGHTVGHAVEAVAKYDVLHGDAVAAGMAAEAALGVALGITGAETVEALRRALSIFRLPIEAPDYPATALLEAMQTDKKRRGGTVRFALLEAIGKAARSDTENWTFEASETDIISVLGG